MKHFRNVHHNINENICHCIFNICHIFIYILSIIESYMYLYFIYYCVIYVSMFYTCQNGVWLLKCDGISVILAILAYYYIERRSQRCVFYIKSKCKKLKHIITSYDYC